MANFFEMYLIEMYFPFYYSHIIKYYKIKSVKLTRHSTNIKKNNKNKKSSVFYTKKPKKMKKCESRVTPPLKYEKIIKLPLLTVPVSKYYSNSIIECNLKTKF